MTKRFYLRTEESGKYTPHCDVCSWTGPTVTDKGLAQILLNAHTKKRVHRTLYYGQGMRFKV